MFNSGKVKYKSTPGHREQEFRIGHIRISALRFSDMAQARKKKVLEGIRKTTPEKDSRNNKCRRDTDRPDSYRYLLPLAKRWKRERKLKLPVSLSRNGGDSPSHSSLVADMD